MLKWSSASIHSRTFSLEGLSPLNSTLMLLVPVTVINIWLEAEYYRCLRELAAHSAEPKLVIWRRNTLTNSHSSNIKKWSCCILSLTSWNISLHWRQRVPCFPLKGQYVQLIYSTMETDGAQNECICRSYAQDFVFSLATSRGITEGFTPMWEWLTCYPITAADWRGLFLAELHVIKQE